MITHLPRTFRSSPRQRTVKAEAAGPGAYLEQMESRVLFSAPYGGSPWPLPGLIQAEDFDTGGEGVAYHDTTAANEGGMYRTADGPDLADGGFNDDGTYAVGWMRDGE